MKNEEKRLLFRDLCVRLPYGVRVKLNGRREKSNKLTIDWLYAYSRHIEDIKPYLRPISSMTEEEKAELKKTTCPEGTGTFGENGLIVPMSHFGDNITYKFMVEIINWLNAHHFDYNNLIEKGLALEADDVIRDELGLSPKHSEDPYKTPIHIEILDKDGSVMSENDYLGIMLLPDNPNGINISLKPIE